MLKLRHKWEIGSIAHTHTKNIKKNTDFFSRFIGVSPKTVNILKSMSIPMSGTAKYYATTYCRHHDNYNCHL